MISYTLFSSLILNVIIITGIIDCNDYVTAGSDVQVKYKGCRDIIYTKNLKNPTSQTTAIYSFKGIPFGEPPVGELRFQKPLPKTFCENTEYDATYYRSPCIQPVLVDFLPLPSEDCLYMNVWTPTLDKSAKLPVMLWIYGGAFLIGSGSQILGNGLFLNPYDGSHLAANGVVVVTINYRLGVFGFLNGNREDAPGNMGLWDQALAINWTRQNINNFGGDPDNILIFGESAGSFSVSIHIVSPITRNWIKGAIMESGAAYVIAFNRPKDYMYNISRKYASKGFGIGCDSTSNIDWIDCLRSKPALLLLAAQSAPVISNVLPGTFVDDLLIWNSDQPYPISDLAPFQPIYEDEFLPISVNKAVKIGDFRRDIKILFGHQEDEGVLVTFGVTIFKGVLIRHNPLVPTDIFTKTQIRNDIKNFIINNDTIGIKISEDYTKDFTCNTTINICSDIIPDPFIICLNFDTILNACPNPNHIRIAAHHVAGDYFLTCPSVLFGSHVSQNQTSFGKVYQYKLTYISDQSISKFSKWTGALHFDEVPLVFGKPFDKILSAFWSDRDRKMSREIIYIWTHFAKYGVPPKVNGNDWPPYSRKSNGITNATYLELHPDDDRLGRVFVDRYRGNDGYFPNCINNCFNYWEDIISGQF